MQNRNKNKDIISYNPMSNLVSVHVNMTRVPTVRQNKRVNKVPLAQCFQTDSHSFLITVFLCSPPAPEFKPENSKYQYLLYQKLKDSINQSNKFTLPCLLQRPLLVSAAS